MELVEFVNQLIITDFDRADLKELGTFAHTQSRVVSVSITM